MVWTQPADVRPMKAICRTHKSWTLSSTQLSTTLPGTLRGLLFRIQMMSSDRSSGEFLVAVAVAEAAILEAAGATPVGAAAILEVVATIHVEPAAAITNSLSSTFGKLLTARVDGNTTLIACRTCLWPLRMLPRNYAGNTVLVTTQNARVSPGNDVRSR